MQKLVFHLACLAGILFFTSCSEERHVRFVLKDVESYVMYAPDSAIRVLKGIPRSSLHKASVRGPYALLYTQAQIRSGISVCSDSLIQNAISYYQYRGSKQHQFLSWLYLGEVYQNSGNRELAMEAFIRAERMAPKQIPPIYLYNLHADKSIVYAENYDSPRALEENQKALFYARRTGRGVSEFRSILNTAILQFRMGDYSGMQQSLDSAQANFGKASLQGRIDYHTLRARLYSKTQAPAQQVESLLDSICELHRHEADINTKTMWAEGYVWAGRPEKALSVLEDVPDTQYDARAYAVLGKALDNLNRPREGLKAYERYVSLSDSLDLVLFKQDTRFIDERFSHLEKKRRATSAFVAILIAILAFGVYLLSRIRKQKAQRTRLQALYNDLKIEYDSLKSLTTNNTKANEQAKQLLGKRLYALSAFFSEDIPGSLERAASSLETLSEDRKELVETIGLLYGIYHPQFVSMLLQHNLSTTEVGLCCLFVLGFRTTEIGDILKRSSYYNITSDIRKKLPIEGKKLSTWLNEQFLALG